MCYRIYCGYCAIMQTCLLINSVFRTCSDALEIRSLQWTTYQANGNLKCCSSMWARWDFWHIWLGFSFNSYEFLIDSGNIDCMFEQNNIALCFSKIWILIFSGRPKFGSLEAHLLNNYFTLLRNIQQMYSFPIYCVY